MSVDGLLRAAAGRLRGAGVESPQREARLLLAHALGVAQERILSGRVRPLTPEDSANFERLVSRREGREPLAYITGSREFWSLPFVVGPGVLIPRPESETLIEEALRRFPGRDSALDVLDLGTGSGCLLLALLSERPNARGLGIDISDAALGYARRNARELGLSHRVRFARGNWCENLDGRFDAILVNPPYIGSEEFQFLAPELGYEPKLALVAGSDGYEAYRKIAGEIGNHLKPGGAALFELGQGQAVALKRILDENGLASLGTVSDLGGIPRCLIAGCRG